MEVQSIFSEKGAKLLVLNNFKFSKAHIAKCGKIRWRCTNTKSRCNAKIYTSADEKTILESQLDHNHEGEKTIARQAISNSVKRKAVEDSTERPSKLIHKELTNNDWASDIGSDDLLRVRRNLYEARRDVLPPLPKDINQVFDAVVNLNLKTKIKDENFLCCLDKENNLIIFSCFTNLYFLCSCDTIYMDTVYFVCENEFHENYIK
uniref:Uncharacterized protein LOC114324436 n=1 Tax=Diabrotica virgifera virgifera TaxID=50390 RepID=A0A6P7F3K8_DIAVI